MKEMGRKRQGWRIMRPKAAVTSPRKAVSWTASPPDAGQRLGHVIGEALEAAAALLDRRDARRGRGVCTSSIRMRKPSVAPA